MPKIPRRLRPLDVFMVTAPLVALAVFVFGSACLDYHRIRQFDDWWSNATSVRKFGWYRVRAALRSPEASRLRERLNPEDPERATVRLRVNRAEFDELSSDVAANWGEWIDAAILTTGDAEIPAKLRFRGDGSAHWTAEKKSLSIKTGKDVLYRGFRRLNFTLKDVLPQYLTNSMAQDFDLLAPQTAVLPVFVNEHYYGIFRFVEDVDESFLRHNLRMPGNIYRADAAERGEYLKGLPREVFINPATWERVANNDRPGAPTEWGIHLLLEDLLGSTIEDHARLMSRLDRDELSRLLALMLISGDPYHMSGVHNQLWYDDPVTGKLHPIVWDLRLLDLENPPRGSNWNRFWRGVLRDPRVMDGALLELAQRLQTDSNEPLLETARERVESTHARYADHFAYDRLRDGVIHPVGDPASTLARFEGNAAVIEGWLDDARVSERLTQLADGTWLIEVRSEGRAAAVLEGFGDELGEGAKLYADVDFDGSIGGADRELELASSGLGTRLVRDERLAAAWTAEGARLEPQPLDYHFLLIAPGADEIRPVYSNGLRFTPLQANPLGEQLAQTDGGAWHPWQLHQLEHPPGKVQRLAGLVQLDSDLHIRRGDQLVIEPGTTLVLGPDVSVVAEGRVIAEGTAQAPITITKADPLLPFGTFALQGPETAGSRFAHASFSGGGGRLVGRVEYKGAVNVYNAPDVTFENCTFADNLRCDDLLNVVKSHVDLTRCRFEGANADSIDYDMSTGTIEDCDVVGSGNDGLDLMTCSPWVRNTRITGSGDKGISIGEAATPRVEDVSITDCVVGVELKDLSTPQFQRTTITGCETGVLARRKNWRYAGAGRGSFLLSEVRDNGTDFQLLDDASITVHDAFPGEVVDELPLHTPFGAPEAGWKRMGGARQVSSLDGDLVASFKRRPGAIGRPLSWATTQIPRQHAVAVTAAGKGAAQVKLGLTVDGETLEVPLLLDGDPSRFRITLLEIPRGQKEIQAIAISVDPEADGADLTIRSIQLLATGTSTF